MSVQLIKDGNGDSTGVFIPMSDWEIITLKHQDLKELVQTDPIAKKINLTELKGCLSDETASEMQKYVTESRLEWEARLAKQF
jgi:hypothetical protein